MGFDRIRAGDAILVNGTIGDHGMSVMSVRSGLEFETEIVSDAAPLNGLIGELLEAGVDIRFMRDATRGGVAGVLADIAERTGLGIEIDEGGLPRLAAVAAATEMLGFDLLTVANEGKIILIVPPDQVEKCLEVMRRNRFGTRGARIGEVVTRDVPLVELITDTGGRRIVQRPYGEELPRIC
jgi:hydrogenase expression/formation protein HypE